MNWCFLTKRVSAGLLCSVLLGWLWACDMGWAQEALPPVLEPLLQNHLRAWNAEGVPLSSSEGPVGDGVARTPLVLVHGIAPSEKALYNWDRFLAAAADNPVFQSRYRVWLFVYEPSRSVEENSALLVRVLKGLQATEELREPFRLVALSQGGLLVRKAMADDAELAGQIEQVITLGSPFHGTPLATPSLFRQHLKEEPLLSPVRLFSRPIYWWTERKFPYFSQDFGWKYDHPALEVSSDEAGLGAYPDLPVEQAEKFLAYAGFFDADAVRLEQAKAHFTELEWEPPAPDLKSVRWGSGHYRMKQMQKRLVELPLRACEDRDFLLTRLNDGLSPVFSQLWLGRHLHQPEESCEARPWQALRKLSAHREARLFFGLDHRDWLAGQTRLKEQVAVRDWLNPQEPARSIFQWLLDDLLATD